MIIISLSNTLSLSMGKWIFTFYHQNQTKTNKQTNVDETRKKNKNSFHLDQKCLSTENETKKNRLNCEHETHSLKKRRRRRWWSVKKNRQMWLSSESIYDFLCFISPRFIVIYKSKKKLKSTMQKKPFTWTYIVMIITTHIRPFSHPLFIWFDFIW